jgi:hypothetical protein
MEKDQESKILGSLETFWDFETQNNGGNEYILHFHCYVEPIQLRHNFSVVVMNYYTYR